LTPTFRVTPGSVKAFESSIRAGFGKGIEVPIKAAKIDGAALKAGILAQVERNPISIPLSWHWKTPPGGPPGNIGVSGAPGSGPAGGTGAPGRASRRRAQAEDAQAAAQERAARQATRDAAAGMTPGMSPQQR